MILDEVIDFLIQKYSKFLQSNDDLGSDEEYYDAEEYLEAITDIVKKEAEAAHTYKILKRLDKQPFLSLQAEKSVKIDSKKPIGRPKGTKKKIVINKSKQKSDVEYDQEYLDSKELEAIAAVIRNKQNQPGLNAIEGLKGIMND